MNRFVEVLTLKFIIQIMQQKQTLKIFHILILADTRFALKINLVNLKTEIDKLHTNKLASAPNDFIKLRNVVKNDVVKKTDYNAKITEIENKIPDISNLPTKTSLTTVENKIPGTNGLVKKTDYNTKITEIENKISDISNLATKTSLTYVENKMPNINGLATN